MGRKQDATNAVSPGNRKNCPICGRELPGPALWCACSYDFRLGRRVLSAKPAIRRMATSEIASVRWRDADGMIRKFRNYPLVIFGVLLTYLALKAWMKANDQFLPSGNSAHGAASFIVACLIAGWFYYSVVSTLSSYDISTWRHTKSDAIIAALGFSLFFCVLPVIPVYWWHKRKERRYVAGIGALSPLVQGESPEAAPTFPANASCDVALTPSAGRRDESRWYHALAAIIFPYVALPWGILSLWRGRYRSGWMLVIVSCLSLPFFIVAVCLWVETRSYSWKWIEPAHVRIGHQGGVDASADWTPGRRSAAKEERRPDRQEPWGDRFSLHTDATSGFSILYPRGWEKLPAAFLEGLRQKGFNMENLRLGVVSPDGALNMQISTEKLDKSVTLREYVDILRARMKEASTHPTVVAEEECEIGGLSAIKQEIDSLTPTTGSPMKTSALRVVRGSVAWTVVFGGDPKRMDESRDIADKVLASFALVGE